MKAQRSLWARSYWEYFLIGVLLALAGVFLWPIFKRSQRYPDKMPSCLSHQKQIAFAVIAYSQNQGELLPRWETVWNDLVNMSESPLDKGFLKCSQAPKLANGYVYNSRLGGKTLGDPTLFLAPDGVKKLDSTTMMLTADGQHNTADGRPANVAFTQADLDWVRHKGYLFASFLDGHVEALTQAGQMTYWRDWLPE
jgi:prepilin-type processing-associated H-X9-DG protein